MSATADTIWQVPAYLPYLQPPLTDKAISSAEMEMGYKLPTEYLSLLWKQNGGYIRYSLPEMVHEKIAGIGPYFPSLTDFDWDECQEYVSYSLEGLVPFDGDGHWHLCLDYRKNPQKPSVTYADVECDRESPIADSFGAYLALLQLKTDDCFVLLSVTDLEEVQAKLSKSLRASFEPPND